MFQFEVSLKLGLLGSFRFHEVWRFSEMVLVQLSLESVIGCLGEHALFFENRQDTHWLIGKGKHINIIILKLVRRKPGHFSFYYKLKVKIYLICIKIYICLFLI